MTRQKAEDHAILFFFLSGVAAWGYAIILFAYELFEWLSNTH